MKAVFYTLIIINILIFPNKNACLKVIVDNKKFYADFGGQIDLQFNHADNAKYFVYKYPIWIYSDTYLTGAYNITSNSTVGSSLKLWTGFDSSSISITNLKISHAYAFLERQNVGRIEFGIKNAVNNDMQISTDKNGFSIANGGVSGSWTNYANLHIYTQAKGHRTYYGSSVNTFWVKPSLYSKYKWLKSSVINYYSPVVFGIQIGVSYVPGESNIGYENIVAGGISYSNKLFDVVDYSFSLTGEFAKAKPEKNLNKLTAWNAGFDVHYKNVIFLFSYGNIGKSGYISSREAEYINAGIAYHASKWKSALTYFESSKGNHKLSSWGVSWEKVFLKSIAYYTDLVAFYAEQPTAESNLGTVFLSGLKLQF